MLPTLEIVYYLLSDLFIEDLLNKQLSELQRELSRKDDELVQVHSELRMMSKRSGSVERSQNGPFSSSPSKYLPEDIGGNYNVLYNKYKALLSEKQTLEESLRNETLANEEQRAYIEILKQMLDDRFDRLALSQWISGLPSREKVDVILELKNLNDQLRSTEREVEGFKERARDDDNEI